MHLIEITNNNDIDNGNRVFYCHRTDSVYTSHSNGYIRRTTKNSKGRRINYQLNPKFKNTTNQYRLSRVLIDNEEIRIKLIKYHAMIYKNTFNV